MEGAPALHLSRPAQPHFNSIVSGLRPVFHLKALLLSTCWADSFRSFLPWLQSQSRKDQIAASRKGGKPSARRERRHAGRVCSLWIALRVHAGVAACGENRRPACPAGCPTRCRCLGRNPRQGDMRPETRTAALIFQGSGTRQDAGRDSRDGCSPRHLPFPRPGCASSCGPTTWCCVFLTRQKSSVPAAVTS